MKIQNSKELGITDLRKNALAIAEAGLAAIDTRSVIRANVRLEGKTLLADMERVSLSGSGRLLVCGVGKCAALAAAELEAILGDRISGGVVLCVGEPKLSFSRVKIFCGTHPLPSHQNVEGAKALVSALEGLGEKDTVLMIVSGGGSTLLCLPLGRDYSEERMIVEKLMNAGAAISELNIVRKHLSLARGGFIAKNAYPARVISLVFSDVPADDLQFIASGPTVLDQTTIDDARAVLVKYNALASCGLKDCALVETPKEEKYFSRVSNIIIASNKIALEAMREKAKQFGFQTKINSACLTGEAREVGARIIEELVKAPARTVYLYGGETTVTVRHNNLGGRNMELALSALRKVKPKMALISFASDGRDNSPIAGAICDSVTAGEAAVKKLYPDAFLEANSSYNFWTQVNGAILTGETGSNVSDLIIAIKE